MITLIEKNSPFFDIKKAQKYFEENRQNLDDTNGFDFLLENSRFFNVYEKGYVGSIFVYQGEDNKYYLAGYCLRKKHAQALEATKRVADMFEELYAHTRHLNAVILLKKAGFKWVSRTKQLLRKRNSKGEK